MADNMIRHPAWPNSRVNAGGGWRAVTERRTGRMVDTPTVRAIEEYFGIYNLEDWLLRAYYLRHATYAELAEELGVTGATIGKWFADMGATYRNVAFRVMEEQLAERPPEIAPHEAETEAG